MKKNYLLIPLVIAPSFLFSQFICLNKDTGFVHEIVIEESGIHAVSKNLNDTIVMDINHTVLYSHPDSSPSFWYKIYANADCEITFEIYAIGDSNTYNFFLYKKKGELSINEIVKKKIAPIRANLYQDDMTMSGTGLSLSSVVSYNNSTPENIIKDFYHTPYHSAMSAKAGDVLLLNIYHIAGSDCGQQFTLNSNNHSQKFQSLYQICYTKQLEKIKVQRFVNLNPRTITKPEIVQPVLSLKNETKAVYIVWDSIKHTIIPAEITWIKKYKNSYTAEKGKGEITLEKNVQYTIVFSAIGYKNKSVTFSTTDSIRSFTHYLFLTPVKEGENFTMDKIYFYPNTYAMKPGARSELDKLVTYLNANPEIKIEIQGYTNGNKRIKANRNDKEEGSFTGSSKKLSQYRAETIKKYLMAKGISEERLTANGYGGSDMIYPNPKNQEQADKNIRVGILILSQKETVLSSIRKTR